MHIILNGEKSDLAGACTLADYLRELDLEAQRVATVVNDNIVPRDRRAEQTLREGDRVEIMVLAGGG